MKKLLIALLTAGLLISGCGSSPRTETPPPPQIVTLQTTAADYESRLLEKINQASEAIGAQGASSLGTPKRSSDARKELIIYSFDADIAMNELVDKASGKLIETNLYVTKADNVIVTTAFVTYLGMIGASNPILNTDDINRICEGLGLDANIVANLGQDKTFVYKGVKYSHKLEEGKGLTFSISTP